MYTLKPSDERSLNRNEGVPYAYTKETPAVDFWSSELVRKIDVTREKRENVLVYIDRKRVAKEVPKEE